jgi:hypothetical protein
MALLRRILREASSLLKVRLSMRVLLLLLRLFGCDCGSALLPNVLCLLSLLRLLLWLLLRPCTARWVLREARCSCVKLPLRLLVPLWVMLTRGWMHRPQCSA